MALSSHQLSPHHERPMSDLNTTPLIDVLLVLLIMFILTIPVQTHQLAVDLPSTAENSIPIHAVRNRVTIDGAGNIAWNGNAVDRSTLRDLAARSARLSARPLLEFKPDADAPYGIVDAVMADIRRAGVTGFGFVGNEAYQRF